eukprot:PhM_4_TR6108/c0_g1_i1/m.8374
MLTNFPASGPTVQKKVNPRERRKVIQSATPATNNNTSKTTAKAPHDQRAAQPGVWSEGCGLFACALLRDRYFFTFGGFTAEQRSIRDVACFDTTRKVWVDLCADTSTLPMRMIGACAVAVDDTIYLMGGVTSVGVSRLCIKLTFGGIDDDAEEDAGPKMIEAAPTTMPEGRYFAAASVMHTPEQHARLALLVGGVVCRSEGLTYHNNVTFLDVARDTWHEAKLVGEIPTPRANHATCVQGTRLFCYGGRRDEVVYDDLYVVDLSADEADDHTLTLYGFWNRIETTASVHPGLRAGHTLHHDDAGRLVLIGGQRWGGPESTTTAPVWVFDEATKEWEPSAASTPSLRRTFHGSCVLHDEICVVGGRHDGEDEDEVKEAALRRARAVELIAIDVAFAAKKSTATSKNNVTTPPMRSTTPPVVSSQTTPPRSPQPAVSRKPPAKRVAPTSPAKKNKAVAPTLTQQQQQRLSESSLSELTASRGAFPLTWVKREEIGRGAFGKVYKAFDSITGAVYAVKEIRVQNSRDVEREVSVLKELSHPNIVKYLGAQLTNSGELHIVLEYIAGQSLSARMKELFRDLPMPLAQVQHCAKNILTGLAYLHSHGIIHRDIKSANVLYATDGCLKLADFGTSKKTEDSGESGLKGTLAYMAPEVLVHQKYTMACDVWSYGCLVLELATSSTVWTGTPLSDNGRHLEALPFIGRYHEIYSTQKSAPVPDINRGVLTKCDSLRDFVSQCLRVDPTKRPTALELLEHSFLTENLIHSVAPQHADPNSMGIAMDSFATMSQHSTPSGTTTTPHTSPTTTMQSASTAPPAQQAKQQQQLPPSVVLRKTVPKNSSASNTNNTNNTAPNNNNSNINNTVPATGGGVVSNTSAKQRRIVRSGTGTGGGARPASSGTAMTVSSSNLQQQKVSPPLSPS